MAPQVIFRGFQVGSESWTFFDTFRIHAREKLTGLPPGSSLGSGAIYRLHSHGEPSQPGDWGTIKVLEAISERSRLVVAFEHGYIKYWIQRQARQTLPDVVTGMQRRLNLSLSFLYEGAFHSATISTTAAVKSSITETDDDYYPSVWQWNLDTVDSNLQRLAESASMYSGGLQVVVAVTGDVAEPQQKAISRGWPAVNSADRLLESMALLVAAPNNQFVTLAAAETEDGPARVKAHRELLTKASPYFDALLNAGFAETSALGGASTPTPAVQTGKRTSTDHRSDNESETSQPKRSTRKSKRARTSRRSTAASPAPSDGRASDAAEPPVTDAILSDDDVEESGSAADTSAAPVINLYDVSYEQLQALVYYVYTGIAVFKGRRPSKKDKKAAEESSKKGASSVSSATSNDTSANSSSTRQTSLATQPTASASTTATSTTTSAEETTSDHIGKLVVSPWNNGTIEPIDALEMYRIADKYDFDELRLSALRWIAADISIDTLVEDLKSREALHIFPPVKRLYLEFCMRNQDQISKLSAYDEIMNYFVANHYLV